MADYPVLIVGAGPTGMELAAELHRYGINFLIIDKRPNCVTTSNACAIHARTMECWHERPWLSSLLEHGLKIKSASINEKKCRLARLDFEQVQHTQYDFVLSVPQSHTEAVLDRYLTSVGVQIKRNATLLELSAKEDNVTARIATPEGELSVSADWVVGCDGYHSTVREQAGIAFEGTDIEERFLLIDADFAADYEPNAFHLYLSPKGISAFFPMQESTRIIVGVGHDPDFKNVKEPTLEVMSEIIKQRTSLQFTLNAIRWQSHFWIHERLAQQFSVGRIFLAGDAAHVHSPAGGQGMNTGIQDAYNLAWKLAYVINRKSPVSLLDSYGAERHSIAQQVVEMTSKMIRVANMRMPFLVAIRNFIMPLFSGRQLFQKILLGRMSELSLHYHPSHIIKGRTIAPFSPGFRALDTLITEGQNIYLYDILKRSQQYYLLVFHADDENKNRLTSLQNKYSDVLSISFYDLSHTKLLETYPFKQFTFCLIRPDQYIAYLGDQINEFENYLQSQFF
ncbi:FAD-dependent monooxygenase [Aquicella lusitana]|uniref:2-polyprenyl-6-methoxyphenol hydroxylase-like FAD-dependent oxidoreductase n=1 Tax=Aquicella lusitana TaxID=254246 RepID=A0A370GYY7_9COXI|nr:FAD-dependent monooxygenase [Aquicella lusitana]RDI48863.1 2-polyprenyl-6-methoxyphenol hydroxylase-like FAD-dependent oxidoreductase [Aquicella lusitana]VVC73291.1 Pentachlorophenol 4-monooxygenase [Aquicella lusitana]